MTRVPTIDSEGTQDPIFLLQSRELVLIDLPSELEHGDDFQIVHRTETDEDGDPVPFSLADIRRDWGAECVAEGWRTERVFLTRAEAEAYGNGRHYEYPDGWRVWCASACGELARGLHGLRVIEGRESEFTGGVQ